MWGYLASGRRERYKERVDDAGRLKEGRYNTRGGGEGAVGLVWFHLRASPLEEQSQRRGTSDGSAHLFDFDPTGRRTDGGRTGGTDTIGTSRSHGRAKGVGLIGPRAEQGKRVGSRVWVPLPRPGDRCHAGAGAGWRRYAAPSPRTRSVHLLSP